MPDSVFDLAGFGTSGYLTAHGDIPLSQAAAGNDQSVDNCGHREPVHETVTSGNGGDPFLGWFGGSHGVCDFGGTAAT